LRRPSKNARSLLLLFASEKEHNNEHDNHSAMVHVQTMPQSKELPPDCYNTQEARILA